jgi:hypothetical protein
MHGLRRIYVKFGALDDDPEYMQFDSQLRRRQLVEWLGTYNIASPQYLGYGVFVILYTNPALEPNVSKSFFELPDAMQAHVETVPGVKPFLR